MARRSWIFAQFKRGLARLSNLFASTHREAPDVAKAKPTNSTNVGFQAPRNDLQKCVLANVVSFLTTWRFLSHDNTRTGLKIHATEERLLATYVGWDHSNPVNDIYLGDGQRSYAGIEGLRPLTENQPNLLRIVCVAIAFCDPPSVVRISRVLRLPEDEVRRSIAAVADHLRTPVVCAGNIKLPAAFVSTIYRSCLQTMGGAHGDIACWCLQGAMSEPRHTRYSLAYWAWHVSQATPSLELKAALESFPFVLCTVTEHQLSNVIHWLKRFKDLIDAAPLISQYEARLANLALI
ncbi:hypothetical protein B0H12DRAFT_637823 [Mycena haematopus]|nr:hypothetical protein B0H12DRAFT_637823 [Mycena haematopus]